MPDPSSYPSESLRQKLREQGLPEEKQHLNGMKSILAAHFDYSQIYPIQNADEIAEILLYLSSKKLLKMDKDVNPG